MLGRISKKSLFALRDHPVVASVHEDVLQAAPAHRRARQAAQLMLEEKKRKEMKIIKRGLQREVKRQHELLQINLRPVDEVKESQSGEKNPEKENISIDGDDLGGEDEITGSKMTELELLEQEIRDGYLEPVDYSASQDQESFETKIKRAEKGELDAKEEERLRRCDRLKGNEDCNITDLAKERAAKKKTTMVITKTLIYFLHLMIIYRKLQVVWGLV